MNNLPLLLLVLALLESSFSYRLHLVAPASLSKRPSTVISKSPKLPSYLSASQPVIDISQPHEVAPKSGLLSSLFAPLKILWDFSRPHTVVGSALSILSLYLYAVPSSLWKSEAFLRSLLFSLVPSVLMNVYITGLNQITDIDIDKVNKPYLPLAAGKMTKGTGIAVVTACLLVSSAFAFFAQWPLRLTLLGSAFLGTVYSLPPFRLKRFPLLAAFCILVVRGSLVNLGFFLQAKVSIVQAAVGSLQGAWEAFPHSFFVTAFFALFGVVIAILKDTPDVQGDKEFKIPTFAVRVGADKMFKTGSALLFALLAGSSALIAKFSSSPFLSLATAAMATDALLKAMKTDTKSSASIFSYYMYIWNIFYACYFLLPFLSLT